MFLCVLVLNKTLLSGFEEGPPITHQLESLEIVKMN
ncbi:unnamed protein product [Arabidopsis lyrata]|nr:unnamed protein product [Arabidopsis lyrata]